MQSITMEYQDNFMMLQGLFVLRCLQMKEQLDGMCVDVYKLARATDSFDVDRLGLIAHPMYIKRQTLVIDLIDTFIIKIDLKSKLELQQIKNSPDYNTYYILISNDQRVNCCDKISAECICRIELYRIRPYTFDFLRAL